MRFLCYDAIMLAMIGYGRHSITEEDVAAVSAVLRGQALTCGPAVDAFEGEIRRLTGAPFAVAVSNGTSALRLLYQVAGIGPGTRVGVPAITFVATASQALLLGAEVVLLDVDPDTLCLTPAILAANRERLDWVIPVHVAGRSCDMAGIAAIAAERGIRVLEDAAHAFGSFDGTNFVGSLAHSQGAIFSYHPVKNITTGEGGAIVVKDAAWDAQLRQLRHHGIVRQGFRGDLQDDYGAPWYHEFHAPASNERMSDLLAALGVSQCQRIETFRAARQAIHDAYRSRLSHLDWLLLPPIAHHQRPFWHLCAARIDLARLGMTRRQVFASAQAAGIALQVHYIPLHHQPILATAVRASDLAGADRAYGGLLSLPCHPELSATDLDRVVVWLSGLARGMRS